MFVDYELFDKVVVPECLVILYDIFEEQTSVWLIGNVAPCSSYFFVVQYTHAEDQVTRLPLYSATYSAHTVPHTPCLHTIGCL